MDLERATPGTRSVQILVFCTFFVLVWLILPVFSQSRPPRKPELIIDTETADNPESADDTKPKEYNPLLASQNVNIGNFYFKRKNYGAAIQRYLAAMEYQPNSTDACEGLARAYEKNGDIPKAVSTYKNFVEKNPDSPKVAEFRTKAEKLEKTLSDK